MWYVYVLRSISNPTFIYIGYTKDLKVRLGQHNEGLSEATKPYNLTKLKFILHFELKIKLKKWSLISKRGKAILKRIEVNEAFVTAEVLAQVA